MADVTQNPQPGWRIDKVWLTAALIPLAIAVFDPGQALETVRFALGALGHTA